MHLLFVSENLSEKKSISFWLCIQPSTKPIEAGSIGKVPSLQGFRANLLI